MPPRLRMNGGSGDRTTRPVKLETIRKQAVRVTRVGSALRLARGLGQRDLETGGTRPGPKRIGPRDRTAR